MLKLNFLKIFSKLFTIRTQTYIKFELIESLFLANFIAFSLVAEMYSYVPNNRAILLILQEKTPTYTFYVGENV